MNEINGDCFFGKKILFNVFFLSSFDGLNIFREKEEIQINIYQIIKLYQKVLIRNKMKGFN